MIIFIDRERSNLCMQTRQNLLCLSSCHRNSLPKKKEVLQHTQEIFRRSTSLAYALHLNFRELKPKAPTTADDDADRRLNSSISFPHERKTSNLKANCITGKTSISSPQIDRPIDRPQLVCATTSSLV